jgi:hypothetical protein
MPAGAVSSSLGCMILTIGRSTLLHHGPGNVQAHRAYLIERDRSYRWADVMTAWAGRRRTICRTVAPFGLAIYGT